MRDASMVVSAQVLNEFYVNATQKLTPGMPREDARSVCRSLAAISCEPITDETIAVAWDVQDRFSLSWWDSLVVSSALLAGCTRLLTEDLQHGLVIDLLRIVNPFATPAGRQGAGGVAMTAPHRRAVPARARPVVFHRVGKPPTREVWIPRHTHQPPSSIVDHKGARGGRTQTTDSTGRTLWNGPKSLSFEALEARSR